MSLVLTEHPFRSAAAFATATNTYGDFMPNQPVGPLMRLPSVETQTGLSKSEIYRRIKVGSFPRPLKLGARAVAWPAMQIDAWVKELIQGTSK